MCTNGFDRGEPSALPAGRTESAGTCIGSIQEKVFGVAQKSLQPPTLTHLAHLPSLGVLTTEPEKVLTLVTNINSNDVQSNDVQATMEQKPVTFKRTGP